MPADAETSVTRNIPKFYSDCSPSCTEYDVIFVHFAHTYILEVSLMSHYFMFNVSYFRDIVILLTKQTICNVLLGMYVGLLMCIRYVTYCI